MNVALVVHDFDPGVGHGRYSFEIARRLARQHSVHVWANRFAVPAEAGLVYRRVPASRRSALLSILTFLANSERLLRRERYDLIHAQGLTCWHADVITAHICNRARIQRHANARSGRHAAFDRIVPRLEAAFYRQRRARQLIAISKCVADEIQTHYGWNRPVQVIYHGTDTDRFRPAQDSRERDAARQQFKLGPNAWAWLFVGEAIKGLSQVIRQLPRFAETHLLVISRSDFSQFRNEAERLGVAHRITFHGPAKNIELAYRAADLFVYPSDYDAFGLVAAEAMASELPVILGKSIGAAQWIVDGTNGLLTTGSEADLRERIAWVQNHPEASRNLGTFARRTVQEHTWDRCAQETETVYEALRSLERS